VPVGAEASVRTALRGVPAVRVVIAAPAPASAATRAEPFLARAREHALAFEREAALASVNEAQVLLEREARDRADFDVLHRALAYRGLIEANLERPDAAREAFRAAAQLRPDAALDEAQFPPDLCALYREIAAQTRAEPPGALAVTTEPAGAAVRLDGEVVGTAPLTVHGSPGRHFVRVDAPARESRMLAIEIGAAGAGPLHVALPPASRDRAAAEVAVLGGRALGADRRVLADAVGAPLVVTVSGADVRRPSVLGLDLRRGTRASVGGADVAAALRSVLADLRRPYAPEESGSAFASPWLWIAVAVVAAGGAVAVYAATTQPDPVLQVTTAP
jgi:hypothetical protein